MSDELVAGLRQWAEYAETAGDEDLLTEAADALEAARAELDADLDDVVFELPRNVVARYVAVPAERLERLTAERDAEAALADRLADALSDAFYAYHEQNAFELDERCEAALDAHRERRQGATS